MCQGRRSLLVGGAALALTMAVGASPARAASASEIDRDVDAALKKAYQAVPEALELTKKAKAVIVFPRIYKAGFMFGAQYGEGAMRKGAKTVGYYNTVAASYGFQAGVQAFGYMLFFLTDHGVKYLEESGGFELWARAPASSSSTAEPPRRSRPRRRRKISPPSSSIKRD
jgi:lipid-binding SYLF domain-containing protein